MLIKTQECYKVDGYIRTDLKLMSSPSNFNFLQKRGTWETISDHSGTLIRVLLKEWGPYINHRAPDLNTQILFYENRPDTVLLPPTVFASWRKRCESQFDEAVVKSVQRNSHCRNAWLMDARQNISSKFLLSPVSILRLECE
ncbi:hypothetical protein NPIL_686231 [Nephila pilipes]|uniref:Uncharacterized protein n=1 Tax=Nephila pilipes TaxID=299642 RepID=A0A8X6QME0_NEPPI|nr:hypothetical protein NPIL_686231 [Nephila pilipes]